MTEDDAHADARSDACCDARPDAPWDGRLGGWEVLHRTLAAQAVVAEAELYAGGWRKLTVEHGGPLTDAAAVLLARLLERVDQAVTDAAGCAVDAAGPGLGAVTCRPTSITWAFPPVGRPARELVLLARKVADRLDPGGWVVTADDHP